MYPTKEQEATLFIE
ncbi:MAG: hypothetical protein JXA38_07130 [Methanosarcinaceae archaeon]|nr:hypothetical protein [Methanosarcinaceae archaeon]